MNGEWLWVLLPPLGWFLWTWGGTGWKPARRWLYPAVLGGLVTLGGVPWWRGLLAACSTSGVAHLGYGDRTGWRGRMGVALGYGGSLLPLSHMRSGGTWILCLLLSGGFLFLLWVSRRWNAVTWKLIEGCHGAGHALGAVWLATH